MAYIKFFYHVIWRTKNSYPTISEDYERDLYKFIWGVVQNNGGKLYRINSMPDHVHMLVEIPPTISIADFVKKVKLASGNFMRNLPEKFPKFTAWAKSYCAISYSENEKDKIKNYIINQKEHHKKESFKDEFLRILQEENIDFDPNYVLSE